MNGDTRKSAKSQFGLQGKRFIVCGVILLTSLLVLSSGFTGCTSSKKATTPKPTFTQSPLPTTYTAVPKTTTSFIPTIPPQPKPTPKPLISLPQGDLNIGTILQKTSVKGSIEVANAGDADLNLYNVDSPSFFLRKSTLPITITPKKSVIFEFSIDTQQPESLESTLHFQTNDTSTSKQDLHIIGTVDPVSIITKERQEQYLQSTSEPQPQYLTVNDLGRQTLWQMQPFPSYSCNWSLSISNQGPGKADGVFTVLAVHGSDTLEDTQIFHLASKDGVSYKFTLPINFFQSIFGGYQYSYFFSGLTEEFLKERTILDVYKVTNSGQEKLDTFQKDSEKDKTWQESDYYKPGSVSISLNLQGSPSMMATAPSPAIQPTALTNFPLPITTSIPVPTLTPPDFDIALSNITQNHSGIFSVSIEVGVHAKITNTGDKDAHNVKAEIRAKAKSNGQQININNQNVYIIPLGNLAGKQTLDRDLNLGMQVGMSTALDLNNNGISFQVDLVSDEVQRTIIEDYP